MPATVQITSGGAIQMAGPLVKLTTTVPCCDDPAQIQLKIDVSWNLAVDDTRWDFFHFVQCALHFNESGSDTITICVTPNSWLQDFSFDFSDICPARSGRCDRTLDPGELDYLDQGGVQARAFGELGGVGGGVFWQLGCHSIATDCINLSADPCGDENGTVMDESIPDPTDPAGTYSFSDSHSETDYSWSWTWQATITKLPC